MKFASFTPLLVAVLCACSHSGVDGGASPPGGEDARMFKRDLLAAIDAADVVELSEHSSPFDFDQLPVSVAMAQPEIVYARVQLDEAGKQAFRKAIETMDEAPPREVASCVPEYHHTIRFFAGGKPASTLSFDPRCKRLEWDGSKGVQPLALYSALEQTIRRAGLDPNRVWPKAIPASAPASAAGT